LSSAFFDAALLHRLVEPDLLQQLVDDLADHLGDEVPDDQDQQEADQLGNERRDGAEAVGDGAAEVDGSQIGRGHSSPRGGQPEERDTVLRLHGAGHEDGEPGPCGWRSNRALTVYARPPGDNRQVLR